MMVDLRESTAAQHAKVEAAMPPLDALATREGYADALRALHGFHRAWESPLWEMAGVSALGLDQHDSHKQRLLEQDLSDLGVSPIPFTCAPPRALDLPRAIGGLYVLEGSTLGGRVILKHVRKSLSVDELHGASYFSGYGEETGSRWMEFGDAVQQFADRTGQGKSVIRGAIECFSAMERWLQRSGVISHSLTPATAQC